MAVAAALALAAHGTALSAQEPAAPRPPASRLPAAQLAVSPGPPAPSAARAAARADSSGRLFAPQMAGQARERATARDNDSTVRAIEQGLRCTCGCNLDVFTCRTTDFTCATSPAMHRVVLARLDSGMTAEQVIAAFQAQYGEVVMMSPPRRGFNWAAYLMPFAGLLAGLVIVGVVIRRWFRAQPRQPLEDVAGEAAPGPAAATDDEILRLRRELERFEA